MKSKPQFPAGSTGDKGYALLLAVVITGAVLAASMTLANVVMSEIKQTRELGQSIQAYVNAETGIEQALFVVKNSDLPVSELKNVFSGMDVDISIDEDQTQYFSIKENDFASITIPLGAVKVSTILNPKINSWVYDNKCSTSWLDISSVSWDSNVGALSPFVQFQHPYPASELDDLRESGISFPQGVPIEMRIRALYCDAQITVTGVPGRLKIKGVGHEGQVRQSIEAMVMRHVPVTGLFDFVIFSEEEIIK